jgi:hypothetical protein
MSAAIVNGDDLDVDVIVAPIELFVLDPHIRKVQLLIEIGQVVLERPLCNLARVAIGMSVVVGMIAIVLMEPPLVVALELVVEHDAFDACAALLEAFGFTFVGAIDLDVVFELPLAFDARVEGLAAVSVAVTVPMMIEQASSLVRERDRDVA